MSRHFIWQYSGQYKSSKWFNFDRTCRSTRWQSQRCTWERKTWGGRSATALEVLSLPGERPVRLQWCSYRQNCKLNCGFNGTENCCLPGLTIFNTQPHNCSCGGQYESLYLKCQTSKLRRRPGILIFWVEWTRFLGLLLHKKEEIQFSFNF